MLAALLTIAIAQHEPSVLITGGLVYDGKGGKPYLADVRIRGNKIDAIGKLKPGPGDEVLKAFGKVVAPGFIDAHSHADGGIFTNPDAESQVRQGITTAVVGQDGGWSKPVAQALRAIEAAKPAINFAMFSGHGGIRTQVMGKDFERKATAAEVAKMAALVEQDMKDGALGLSTGLEYNPGYYSSTEELIELARIAGRHHGIYISHVRDETHGVFDSFEELERIGSEGRLPAQISHIKMAVTTVWGKADRALRFLHLGSRSGITADVYPYLYWQSTIRVLTNSRDWGNRQVWVDALKDVGGPQSVRLTVYSVNPSWAGKTLQEISKLTGKEPADLIMEIIEATKDGKGSESIVCQSMIEEDLKKFIKHPLVMFCSDGAINGTHPRGAGSFPRILGRYVRELKVLTLQEAIRKMTSFPAWRFTFRDRGTLEPGKIADVVVFHPAQIADMATPANPRALSVGMIHVLVNGRPVLRDGKMTTARPGIALRRQS
jgi:N-acyl-D-amino-acid deacylase